MQDDATQASGHIPADPAQRFRLAEIAAEQIWREQQLTSNRLQWNLTTQGFLLAAYAFAFGDMMLRMDPDAALVIKLALALAGAGTAWYTQRSVEASQTQRDYMKRVWRRAFMVGGVDDAAGAFVAREDDEDILVGLNIYPRPYSVSTVSWRARNLSIKLNRLLVGIWGVLLVVAIYDYAVQGKYGRVAEFVFSSSVALVEVAAPAPTAAPPS